MLPFVLLAAALRVGEPAPDIALDRLLPERPIAEASLPSLRGKAVVLEFWATWCGPCVAAIPHWNELAAKFREKPVVFLSVTDESPETIEKFVAKRPIEGWLGIVKGKLLHNAYGVKGIPQTFLIDATGKLAGQLHPSRLTAAMLEDLAAGRTVQVPPRPSPMSFRDDGSAPGAAPLIDVIVRPSTEEDGESGMSSGPDKIYFKARELRDIVAYCWSMPRERIEGERVAEPTRYDFSVSLPGTGPDRLKALAMNVVETAFGITAKTELRETDVWVLTAPRGKPDALVAAERSPVVGSSSGNGTLGMKNGSTWLLARILERDAGKPVVDETGLTGRYNLEFRYEPDALAEGLRKIGLELSPGRRRVEFLIVSKAR